MKNSQQSDIFVLPSMDVAGNQELAKHGENWKYSSAAVTSIF